MPVGAVFLTLKPLPPRRKVGAAGGEGEAEGGPEREGEGDGVEGEGERGVVLLSESFYQMSWQKAKVYMYAIVETELI